mgnify:CR=1 FL=1
MDRAEKYAERIFKKLKFTASRYGKSVNGKAPDFFVCEEGHTIFLCEVKTVCDDEESYERETVELDNTYNRIAAKIHTAYKQFSNVNKNHILPNVLFIYNEEIGNDINDFVFTYEGQMRATSGNTYALALKKTLEYKRIEEEKKYIDACIWYNESEDDLKVTFYSNSKYLADLKKWLGSINTEIQFY